MCRVAFDADPGYPAFLPSDFSEAARVAAEALQQAQEHKLATVNRSSAQVQELLEQVFASVCLKPVSFMNDSKE